MTSTLFLSDAITALVAPDAHDPVHEAVRAPSLFSRKTQVKRGAGAHLEALGREGDVVACLPLGATSCQTLKVSAQIGRQVLHGDISDALEVALSKAGAPGHAVICAEPTEVRLDGQVVEGSAVGKPAGTLEMVVTAFVSPLSLLADLERAALEADLRLSGVMAAEEAASASLGTDRRPVLLIDTWTTKYIVFTGEGVKASVTLPIGSGHVALDLKVSFDLSDSGAEKLAERYILDRCGAADADKVEVAAARLDELANGCREAADAAGFEMSDALILGLPASPRVVELWARAGLRVSAPGLSMPKTSPPLLTLVRGAAKLADGAVPRADAMALQLEGSQDTPSALKWLRKNF
ncbi:MAG: hypothetical protein AAGI89_12725 [Pseudomonadota bacterium]